jgi:hypothetical protein
MTNSSKASALALRKRSLKGTFEVLTQGNAAAHRLLYKNI